MKPVVYSKEAAAEKFLGWYRSGEDISYFPNEILRQNCKSFYTLRFSYTFKYSNDTVWFAYSYPYTYTQLTEFLNTLESNKLIEKYGLFISQ